MNPQYRQPDDTSENNEFQLGLFLAFQIVGGLGNIVMLITALVSRRVVRHSTWINFCFTWIIYSLSYTLLFFTGQNKDSMSPSYPLCLTQAALVYGAPVLTGFSSLSLIIQIWLHLRKVVVDDWDKDSDLPKRSSLQLVLLLVIPYIAWFGVSSGAFVYGLRHPLDVTKVESTVYCGISTGVPGKISACILTASVVLSICFQGAIVQTLYECNWRARKEGLRGNPGQVSMSIVIRTCCYIVINIVAVSMIMLFAFTSYMYSVDVSISLMPLVVFLLFSTQRDIMRVWTFRN